MKQLLTIIIALLIAAINSGADAQDSFTINSRRGSFPDQLFKEIGSRSEAAVQKFMSQSDRYISDMAKEERRLKRKLFRKDAVAADEIFGNAENQYSLLRQKLKFAGHQSSNLPRKYFPHLDSLQTALKFFHKSEGLINSNPGTDTLLKQALANINLLQEKLSQVDQVRQFTNQRRKFLQDQLGAYGLLKDLRKLQKRVYYYNVRMKQYKGEIENPSMIEARALAILRKTTLFKNFFKTHSQLAGLFRLPESSQENSIAGFTGLQTRQSIDQQLLQKFGALPDVQQVALRQVSEEQDQLSQLKNNMAGLSQGNGDAAMPDFKPNNQKTRAFAERLELGTNLQTVKSNNFFPATSDIALSIGYKISDKTTVGIGSSYKMGWGRSIRQITISHQGIGLRSFIDVKIKGNFWLAGGAEMNYRSQFSNFELLNRYTPWQKSALMGLSKKYLVSKKIKGNMQFMYDFLHKQQVPRLQPVVFRIGYVW